MRETLTGIEHTGDWESLVRVGEAITQHLRDADVENEGYGPEMAEWDEWRPAVGDRLSKEVAERTANHAQVKENEIEQAGISPSEEASNGASEMRKVAEVTDTQTQYEKLRASALHFGRSIETFSRKSLRRVEHFVYKHIMTQLSPYYFDNTLISANVTRDGKGTYTLEVNLNDDEIQSAVVDKITEEQTLPPHEQEREVETETVATAEGVPDEEANLKP